MPSTKEKKLKKFLADMNSSSDGDESEHELFYYAKDRVKLMKEVLKLIKPKKIKAMAPDCIKNLDVVEINSMLLEELLGISKKRLRYIFNGENVDRESSSSESEEENPPIDVISLDDISDDDIQLCISDSEKKDIIKKVKDQSKERKKHRSHRIKKEPNIKTERTDRSKKKRLEKSENVKESEKDKLMSVLELLELQARARAIRSQLAIESEDKNEPSTSAQNKDIKKEDGGSDSDVIIASPEQKEIVITSSESENEDGTDKDANTSVQGREIEVIDLEGGETDAATVEEMKRSIAQRKEKLLTKIQKIRLNRNKITTEQKEKESGTTATTTESGVSKSCEASAEVKDEQQTRKNEQKEQEGDTGEAKSDVSVTEAVSRDCSLKDRDKISSNECDTDEIVINLSDDEMNEMENNQ